VEVTKDYFPTLGLAPVLGRTLTFREDSSSEREAAEAVLSHSFWQSHFAGDRAVLGRVLILDGEPFEVVGVMPRAGSFPYLGRGDLWIPLHLDVAEALQTPERGFAAIGRLAPGVELEAAQRDLNAVALALESELPALHRSWGAEVKTLHWWVAGDVRPAFLAVFAAALSILLVAAANVASLALEKLMGRQREIETRLALGASRSQLRSLFLAEGVLLAFVGGAGGWVVAGAGIRLLRSLAPEHLSKLDEAGLDMRVLAFTVILSLVSGMLALGVPAAFSIRQAAFGSTNWKGKKKGLGQPLLVMVQVAVVLAVGFAAALVARSQDHLRQVSPGFETQDLLVAGLQLPTDEVRRGAEREAALRRLLEQVENLPGVRAAAVSAQPLPLEDDQGIFTFYPPGVPEEPGNEAKALAATVSSGYFEALAIPLLRGRAFSSEESWEQAQVVMINATLARRYWPDRDPIGQEIRFGGQDSRRGRIIGVVEDTRQMALHIPPAGQLFVPWGEAPARQRLILRGEQVSTLLPLLRSTAWKEASGIVFDVQLGEEILEEALARHRFFAVLLRCAAILTWILGVVGIYGLVASDVSRRTREIGIRMALGSTPSMILGRTVQLALAPVALGVVLGLGGTAFVGRGLEELLFETRPLEPGALVAALTLLSLAALAACLLPARRAARLNTVEALRADG